MSTTGGGSMDEQGQEPVDELTLEAPATLRSRRPRALWAVLGVVAVAAGALVVTSADDDGDQRPGLPVDLASLTRSGGDDAEAAADAMLAWVVYVPGDDLPALGGEAPAYRLSGEVTEAQVRDLAEAVGLVGDVQSDGAGSWTVTGDGGQGQLGVHSGSGAGWSYFSGHADCVAADGGVVGCTTDCAVSSDGTETCAGSGGAPPVPLTTVVEPDCEQVSDDRMECQTSTEVGVAEPAPDTGSGCADDDCVAPDSTIEPAPDRPAGGTTTPPDDVAQVALDVVAASGADVGGAIVSALPSGAEEGSGSWYVTVEPRLDGVPSGLVSYVEVSSDLRVIAGNGYVGRPEPLGEYPLLDTRAAIERANEQQSDGGGDEPAIGDADDAAAGTTGGTETGVIDDVEATVTTVAETSEPCADPEGASDVCGGTTGCGGDGCVEPTTSTIPCKVQPDGSEICEVEGCGVETTADSGAVDVQPCETPACSQPGGTDGVALGAPEDIECTPPPPIPLPEPEPVEIVLVDAERSLVLLPANDGSGDAYLVPAYRFTAADGGTVDLPAVADEALAGPTSTETTVPATTVPEPEPVPEPQPCEVLEEEDPGTETTHTVQTCPDPDEDALEIGGDGYYVDIDVECAGGSFFLGGRIWVTDDEDVATWADPGERHEGGMFTLEAEDHGTFVGDANGALTAEFRTLGPAEDIFCTPQPRA